MFDSTKYKNIIYNVILKLCSWVLEQHRQWFMFFVSSHFPECINPHPRVKFSSDLPTYIDVWTRASAMSRTLVMRTQRFQALFSTCACWTLTLLCSVNTRTNFVQLFYTSVYSIKHFWCCSFLKTPLCTKSEGKASMKGGQKDKYSWLPVCLFVLLTAAVQYSWA